MEKDSFERPEVAKILNRHFISIKVDREERPDLDRIYMDAVVRMAGRGGWPMSVFLTPDLQPFFGGTFFRRPKFMQILNRLAKQWNADPEAILDTAYELSEDLRTQKQLRASSLPGDDVFNKFYQQLQRRFDRKHGGFGSAPKFPPSVRLQLLLRIYRRSGSKPALAMATKTLDAMAAGGMYDHVGGGFHRYSTDARWHAPHFEKMLYDNALLAQTYLEAYQVTKKKAYATIARGILDYILREMTAPNGGFYSAEDAGEVGHEGKYYIWSVTELKKALTRQEFGLLSKHYVIVPKGNFEAGKNILYLQSSQSLPVLDSAPLQKIHAKLLSIRDKRHHPHKDDKILTGWNGLMIGAMAFGSRVLDDARYLKAAQAGAQFIRDRLWIEGQLLRRYRDGDARYPSYLNDYAFLIQGLIQLYTVDYNPTWLEWALQLQYKQDTLFRDPKDGAYFFSDAQDDSVIIRQKPSSDGAIPSANGTTALNLLRLFGLSLDDRWQEQADKLLRAMSSNLKRGPAWNSQALIALDYRLDDAKEIAIIPGNDSKSIKAFKKLLGNNFLPNQVSALSKTDNDSSKVFPTLLMKKIAQQGRTTYYVCEDHICKLPTTDLSVATRLLKNFKPYKLSD